MAVLTDPRSLSTDEGREFLRHRTSMFGLVSAAFAGVFLVVRTGSQLYYEEYDTLVAPSMFAHASGVAFMTVLWLGLRPGVSPRVVRALELVCVLGASASYCALVVDIPQGVRPDVKIGAALAMQMVGRAVYVPSSARRTAILCALVSIPFGTALVWMFWELDPLLVATMAASRDGPTDEVSVRVGVIGEDALWWIGTSVVSTSISAVIYGLRRDAHRARRLGQYMLEAKLGQGGMGVVYRAHHAMLRRPTAIKLLHPDRLGAQSLTRFEREVRTTAGLSHPNTVTIFDFGRTPDGTFYYAMELLDGATLTQIVKLAGPMPPERVIYVITQVCGALAEAHDAGLIHRDVKPDNILLTKRGGLFDFAKVVDFGLVKEIDAGAELTHEDAILGTPLYMAPEAIRGKARADGRSDLYAVGAVAYFLLTGEHVFAGDTVIEIMSAHLKETPEPPSARLGATVPADLEKLVLACLEKDPEKRPKNALELARALSLCEHANKWTKERAERWWRDYGPELAPAEEGVGDTIAIDLAAR
jgi:hypothetical protein